MSIQALKKVSLIGERSQKTKILEELQSIGKIHLMDVAVPKEGLNQAESARQHSAHSLSGQLKKAINYLEQRRDLLDKRDRLNDRIQSLTPWGNFHLPPGSTLAGFKLWFYILPRRQKKALAELKLPWHIVHSDSHQHWVGRSARPNPVFRSVKSVQTPSCRYQCTQGCRVTQLRHNKSFCHLWMVPRETYPSTHAIL